MLNHVQTIEKEITMEKLRSELADIKKLVEHLLDEKNGIDDWITEKHAIKISGLCRGTLFKLRKEGKVSSSTLSGKQNFYRLSDLKKLLDINEQKR